MSRQKSAIRSTMDESIKILVTKYVSGTLSDTEAVRLASWVKISPSHTEMFRREVRNLESAGTTTADAVDFWNRVSKGKFTKHKEHKFRSSLWIYSGIVAAVVLLIGLSMMFRSSSTEKDNAQILVADAQQEQVISETKVKSHIYTAAAGERKSVILPDSTKVILNSGARLILSDDFNRQERRVYLDGEAFFEVFRNPAKTFTVCCRDNEYIVRGTSFNVSSYSDDPLSIVTLVTGRLEARIQEDVIMMKPGDELRVDSGMNQITKQTVDISNSARWRNDGQLSFSGLPLKYVASQLTHKYNTRINVHSAIENIVYDGQIDRESLQDALRLITMTSPVELSVIEFNGEYYISKKSSQLH